MQELRNCKFCGKEILAKRKNHVYCCSNCALKARNKLEREEHQEEKPEIKPKKMDKLAEINEAARAAGMTYGKYVAMQYAKTLSFHGGEDDKSAMHGLP